ncbi:MAG: acyl carrier protein [Tatlockia sp.]|nr:acyl carrier protein [Tatlockia sp.]
MNNRLVSVLSEVFGLRADDIVVELTKANVGSWDSLKQMDLVVSLEREFNVVLEIPDIIKMDSVGQIIDVLASKGVDLGA